MASIKTKGIIESFKFLSESIKKEGRLFFVRFGDGEFVTMMQENHRNYVYNENLDKEIEASFRVRDKDYLIACPINYPYDEFHAKGIYTIFPWQQKMVDLFEKKGFLKETVFENPYIFHCMGLFKPQVLKLFLNEHIRPKTKMFIGSTDKNVAEKLYGEIDYYVRIPAKHAYETINDWWPLVEENAAKVDLVIPSAGSTSNAISVRLWNLGVDCKVIDFGSIIDAVDGKQSRTWIRLQGHKILKLVDNKEKLSIKERVIILGKDIKFYFRNQII